MGKQQKTMFLYYITILVLLISINEAKAQSAPQPGLRFESLTLDDGLPDNTVRTIMQDSNGFLWFGSSKGVVRFDGYRMVTLASLVVSGNNPNESSVKHIAEGRDGRIWIAFQNDGLGVFDLSSGRYRHFSSEKAGLSNFPVLDVTDICEDLRGNLWVGTSNSGLFRYSIEEDRFYGTDGKQNLSMILPDKRVTSVAADSSGGIWVGFQSRGLVKIHPETGTIRSFRHEQNQPDSLPGDQVRDINVSPAGKVWISTYSGLALFDEGTESFQAWKPKEQTEIQGSNFLLKMAFDSQSRIWLGSESGLIVFDPKTELFSRFSKNAQHPGFPTSGVVISPYCDSSGIVWAGTWLAGIVKFDPGAQHFDNQRHDRENPQSLDNDLVQSVLLEKDGSVWVGTGSMFSIGDVSGLNLRKPGSREFEHFYFGDSEINGVSALAGSFDQDLFVGTTGGLWKISAAAPEPVAVVLNPDHTRRPLVRALLLDSHGYLWIGSTNMGLFKQDRSTHEIFHFSDEANDSTSLKSHQVICLHEDQQGRIWVGTDGGGLNLFNPTDGTFRHFLNGTRHLSSVLDIADGAQGQLWVGTYGGLVEFSPEQGIHRIINRKSGLPNDVVSSLQIDSSGRVWFSTGRGLVRFNPDSSSFKIFTTMDGLPGNGLCFASGASSDGRIYFGGDNGLFSFQPSQLKDRNFAPPVVITDLNVFSPDLAPTGDVYQSINPINLNSLDLGHDQNDLDFTFAALDFTRPESIRYKYRLENYDNIWKAADLSRKAVYTNLAPGHYSFRVKATNSDGVWNPQERIVAICISPPWWRTWWAYLLLFSIILLVVGLVFRQVIVRERMRGALDVKRIEAKQLKDLNTMRSRFFANISHEFRTPLTLIKGPLHQLRINPSSGDRPTFAMMYRNAGRLQELIDQLLDLSRLEARRLPVKRMHGDGRQFLQILVASYQTLADDRQIKLESSFPLEICDGWFDPDLVEKVVTNLLTNAFKFTPCSGVVRVEVRCGAQFSINSRSGMLKQTMLEIIVANTGSFISPEDKIHIFERFYQVATRQDTGEAGSGIGLALVHELVTLQGGSIQVESTKGEETVFHVNLPIMLEEPHDAVKDVEMVYEAKVSPTGLLIEPLEGELSPAEGLDEVGTTDQPLILVVEDHGELRGFLRDQLHGSYRILEAAHGDQGLKIALAEIPDLVLSDVMMPGLNGFELCSSLKNDRRTNHVPVILLTARTEAESRIEGLGMGADDYLAKPFDPDELKVRIKNLIEMREKLRKVFAGQVTYLDPASMPEENSDERFLKELQTIIAEKLSDSDFNVDALSRQMGLSRMNLHRKLKALLGQTPGVLLKTSRLKMAAKLLEGPNTNVTEAAFSSGFRSLGHFSSNFKAQFGMTPSEYREKKSK